MGTLSLGPAPLNHGAHDGTATHAPSEVRKINNVTIEVNSRWRYEVVNMRPRTFSPESQARAGASSAIDEQCTFSLDAAFRQRTG